MPEPQLQPKGTAIVDSHGTLNAAALAHASFVLAVDSDGCAFDNMNLKHNECFTPTTIRYWGLESVAREARETATFINLRSRHRGLNRFAALVRLFDMLKDRPEVRIRLKLPCFDGLRRWVATSDQLSRASLQAAMQTDDCPSLRNALAWTDAINKAVRATTHDVAPVPGVGECLQLAAARASIVIVSAADTPTLRREWSQHGLLRNVTAVAGQEAGTKSDTLKRLRSFGFRADAILMVGDAPGDLAAAQAANTAFFPIVPGEESASWARLAGEGLPRFLADDFCGDYEENLAKQFLTALPENPDWKTCSADEKVH